MILGVYIVFLPLGHKGRCASHKDKIFLGVDGGEHVHGHKPEHTIVSDYLLIVIGVRGV